MRNKIIFLSFIFILIFYTTSFASIDLSDEKMAYTWAVYGIGNGDNETTNNKYYPPQTRTPAFIENLFNKIEEVLSNNNINLENYPHGAIYSDGSNFYISFSNSISEKTNTGFLFKGGIQISINFNSDYSIKTTSFKTFSYDNGFNFNYGANSISLTDIPNFVNTYVPYQTAQSRLEYVPSNSEVDVLNPEDLNNNFIINKDFIVGDNYIHEVNVYYFSGDSKIYINSYISYYVEELYYGSLFLPYIDKNLISFIPNNKTFYADIDVVGAGGGLSNFNKSFNNLEWFKTMYDNDDPIISGDNSGDSGNTGGGSSSYPDYSNQLNNIQTGINNIENKISTSGDIQQSTTVGIVQGNTDYWGSSGDLNGDKQEDLISGKIDELTNTLSGDLSENEIFGILQTYEDKLFGGFTGEEDFVISWDDINYNGQILIPKGEVNFSQICRENEALGNVKSTINIILTFIILMNIVIYMYNLLLATLGIDNPYLYEKPVGSVTTSEYTDESGRTYVTRTQYDGRGNSISKRYDHTAEPKKRQIGFRKW